MPSMHCVHSVVKFIYIVASLNLVSYHSYLWFEHITCTASVFHVYSVLLAMVTVLYNSTYFCYISKILPCLTDLFLYTHPLAAITLFSISKSRF